MGHENAAGESPSRAVAAGRPAPHQLVQAAFRKIEFGDFILFLYVVTFARQYLWPVGSEVTVWALTLAAAALIWSLHLAAKSPVVERTPRQFWLLVALPLLVVYGMRAALPDTSFDFINYRLVNSERALRGWPFLPGDFFPAFYPLNPAPDMLLGIPRFLLGYRLGTIANLCVLLWTGTIIERLFRPYFRKALLRSFCVLLVIWTEHTLFLINNYLVDLLALPLLLLAIDMALRAGKKELSKADAVKFGVLIGASVALKLFNLAYAIPIIAIYLYNLFAARRTLIMLRSLRNALLNVIGFALPLLPYTAYIYRETGNPVFPFYNTIFRSPFWPNSNLADGRWGPRGVWQTIVWPLRVAFKHERIGELAVYSGRLSIAVVAAALCFVFARGDSRLRALGFAVLLGAFLWGAVLTGYPRYAIFIEMLGGMVLLCFVSKLFAAGETAGRLASPLRRVLGLVLVCALAVQVVVATVYVSRYEWSMRPTVFADFSAYKQEARFFLRDYSLPKFLAPGDAQLLTDTDVWIESGLLTSGYEVLTAPDAPILCAYVHDYFYSAEGREKFARALDEAGGGRIASLCLEDQVEACRQVVTRRGLEIVETVPVKIAVYSRRTHVRMVLLRLRPFTP